LTVRILFPRLVVGCFALFFTASVAAQTSDAEAPQTRTTINSKGASRLETELLATPLFEEKRTRTVASATLTSHFDQVLLTAIQSHLGATYRYNRTGPDSFDCSGFVWRAFQDVGVNFQRGPARSYWATFAVPSKENRFKFGTLVFFSGLTHVGIVADEKGFYHSSRHHGVVYSPFNDYWLSRIDGFRRAPEREMPTVNEKTQAVKSIPSGQTGDSGPR